MKIILLKDIDKIGKKYEIKEVADGYAKNFLIPQKLVQKANQQNIKIFETLKKNQQIKIKNNQKQIEKFIEIIIDKKIKFTTKVNEKGRLFASITKLNIVKKINQDFDFQLKEEEVELAESIKQLGQHLVKINFDYNLKTQLTIVIEAEK